MTNTVDQSDWAGKKLLSLMIIAGLSISALSVFMLSDGANNSLLSNGQVTMLCDNGLCYQPDSKIMPVGTFMQQSINETINQNEKRVETMPSGKFIQQSAELSNNKSIIQNTESFSKLNFKNDKQVNFELSETSAILYPSKDTFLRESLKDINEGGNEVLRVMGSGPTNNRALIAFDQNDLESVVADKILESAKLRLFIASNDGQWNENGVSIHMVNTNWSEGAEINAPFGSFVGTQIGATWNCSSLDECKNWNGGQFSMIPTASITIDNNANGQWIEFDVTGDVMSFLDNVENNGWIIMKTDEDSSGRINFIASECNNCDTKPQLELTFA